MPLVRCTPEAAGVSSRAVYNFMRAVAEEKHEMHGFMLLKDGKVLYERWWAPYGPSYRHQMFSLSKSFTSTAVGFAVTEGLLTVDTLLSDIFKDEFKALGQRVDDEVRGMTIKNLLTMSTGMEYEGWCRSAEMNNITSFLSSHVKDTPGQTFRYSTIATYMCSAAVTRLTGQTVTDYLRPRLFDPLGIDPLWENDPKTGVDMGGTGLNITTEDIAKFGQFILQKGAWEGKQLLPAAWIEEATRAHISNGNKDGDWAMGYGYQFWRCKPEGVFRGDGMYGQFCVISPADNIVIAANSNVDLGRVLDLFWVMLDEIRSLPANGDGAAELAGINGLTHLRVDENSGAYPVLRAAYKWACPEENPTNITALSFDFKAGDGVVSMETNPDKRDGFYFPAAVYYCAEKQWTKGAAPLSPYMKRVMINGEWDRNVLTLTLWCYEMAGRSQCRFTFSADYSELKMERKGIGCGEQFTEIGRYAQ